MASPSSNTEGLQQPQSTWGEYNNIIFVVSQALAKMQTNTLVKVIACTNDGGLSPVGYVDVVPMINQIDAQGNPIPHVTLHNLPYLRIQGGNNAVIIDPEPGDIGIAAFASRDISRVKTTRKIGNPGSFRKYSFSDGMYLGGVLNGAPTQYIEFSATGIVINSPVTVNIVAPNVNVTATTEASITAPQINLGSSGETLLALVTSAFVSFFNGHVHTDPQGGTTGAPTSPMGASHMTTAVKGG